MDKDGWRGAVICRMDPGSFMDSNGHGMGDRPGVTAPLNHVAPRGIDAPQALFDFSGQRS